MPKQLVRWRIEGETLVDCDSTKEASDQMSGWLRNWTRDDDTTVEEPEILSCETVDWGNK